MKKIIKTILFVATICASFYVTEYAAILARNKNPLMQEILNYEKETIEPVNAIIENDTIIPGKCGEVVNDLKSFNNMKAINEFNKYYLVYDEIKPDISLEDNMKKIIIKGNDEYNFVYLIIDNNLEISKYLENNKINYTNTITNEANTNKNVILKGNNIKNIINASDYCLYEDSTYEYCVLHHKYIIKPSIYFANSNIIKTKELLTKGSIIYINKDISKVNMELLLKEINYRGLIPKDLSLLVTE